ncbi:MAG: ankyrin repeat domain-containing protein [Myxococcales bacterium]
MLTMLILISAALPLAAAAQATKPAEVEQLFTAIREGRVEEAKRLLDANPSLAAGRSSKGLSTVTAALFLRSGEGFVPVAKNAILSALLKHRAPIDRFEAAALSGRVRVAQEIDADPAYLTAESSFGWTPLHFAAYGGNVGVARLLLDRGAPIDRRANTKFRNTSLQVSLLTGQEEMAAFLVSRGADVRIEQEEGFTALHEAAQIGSEKLIALFLDRGADPNSRAKDGRTPLGVARKAGHGAAAKMLESRGARETVAAGPER